MAYSVAISKAFNAFFKAHELRYGFKAENGVFDLGFNLSDCKINSVRMYVMVHEKSFTIYSVLPIRANEDVRLKVAEFITRANYGLRNGNFEMDFDDGEIRYKVFTNCGDIEPTEDQITDFVIANNMIKRYADGLVSVLFGFTDPKAAIKQIEG